jgi:hypothetical protein
MQTGQRNRDAGPPRIVRLPVAGLVGFASGWIVGQVAPGLGLAVGVVVALGILSALNRTVYRHWRLLRSGDRHTS